MRSSTLACYAFTECCWKLNEQWICDGSISKDGHDNGCERWTCLIFERKDKILSRWSVISLLINKSHWSGHRLVKSLCEEADCSDFDIFERTGTSWSWPGKSVLSTTEIFLDSGEWRASRVEFDINGRQRHQSSSKGSLLVDYQSVSAERSRLQSRYKTFKLLNSETDCQPVC